MLAKRVTYYLLISLSIALLVTCSPTEKYKVLSFVFDGVPDPDITEQDTLLVAEATNNVNKNKNQFVANKFFHEPYKERDCSMCHDAVVRNKLNEEQPALCYNCHDDFSDKYEVVHGPVAGGFCTECHTPHMGDYEKLLLRQGQEMCLKCHDSRDVFKNENHEDIGEESCTECHNPHGGEDQFMFN